MIHFVFFFFSSRRRHTRFDCDWSSDVCSSDLAHVEPSRRAPRAASTGTCFALFSECHPRRLHCALCPRRRSMQTFRRTAAVLIFPAIAYLGASCERETPTAAAPQPAMQVTTASTLV